VIRVPRWAHASTGVAAGLLIAAGALLAAQSAGAVTIPGTAGGRLSLEADSYPAHWTDVQPGDSVDWQLWPVLEGESGAELSLEITRSGDLVQTSDGLQLDLRSCPVPWQPAASAIPTAPQECAGGAGTTIVDGPMAAVPQNSSYLLGEMNAGPGPYLLATLSVPSTMVPSAQQQTDGWSADFSFGFAVAGQVVTVTPAGSLASTGIDPLGPILFGLGALLAGLVLAVSRLQAREVRR